jgi:hypothetical protein
MKKRLVIFFAVSILSVHLIVAQNLGGVYVNPQTMQTWNNAISAYLDTVITNRINSNYYSQMVFSQMVFNQMMMDNLKTKYGKERMANGRASTVFTPTVKDSFIEKSAQNIENLQDRQKFTAANRQLLETFQTAITQNRLTQNDLADGRALAFVIAYQILNDEFPGKQRLEWMRRNIRQTLLADVRFQGSLDDEKQQEYEQLGIRAILASYASNSSKRTNLSSNERAQAEQTAKSIAENIVTQVFGKSAGAVEMTAEGFGNKAERLVTQGKGLTTFRRSPQLMTQTNSTDEAALDQNLIGKFDREVKARGGQMNDLAIANAVAFDLAYQIVNEKANLNAAQFKWLADEMVKDITNGAQAVAFQSLTDGQKQANYEDLAIKSMTLVNERIRLDNILKNKSGDALSNLSKAYEVKVPSQNLRSNAQKLMVYIFNPRNLDDYELTENGFRKVR